MRAAAAATSRGKGGSERYTSGGGEQAAGGACNKQLNIGYQVFYSKLEFVTSKPGVHLRGVPAAPP